MLRDHVCWVPVATHGADNTGALDHALIVYVGIKYIMRLLYTYTGALDHVLIVYVVINIYILSHSDICGTVLPDLNSIY